MDRILADVPLENPRDDGLGYASFSENLANSICNIDTDECLVFTLCGPWGSGKTTCINFILHYIKEKPKEQRPTIVRFNPWWFSGRGELLNQFFREFCVALGKEERFKKAVRTIADLLQVVSEIPEPTGFGKYGAKVASCWFRQAAKEKELWRLREEIREDLKKQNKHILVIIDDIDRLTSDEIRGLFRVIKAVADFPNTAYLLAFDRSVIVKALEKMQEISGEEFLEKIAQVPLDLPAPDKLALQKIFFEHLDSVLSDTPQDLFDQTYWGNVFWDGIDHFLNTMRNVKSLTNAIRVAYPTIRGEVNPVDFVAIETIRVFAPDIYQLIRSNPDMFAGHLDTVGESGDNVEELKLFHDKWLEQAPEGHKEAMKRLMIRIFPKLDAVFGNTGWDADWIHEWRRKLRICSPDIFPTYFRFAVPEGEISRLGMQAILALAEDSKAFGNKLIELSQQTRPDGSTRVSAFLERLKDYTEKYILEEHIPEVLQAIFNVGDELLLPADEGRSLFSWGNDTRINRIAFQLIKRYESQEERFKILKKVFSKGHAVSIIIGEVYTLGWQHGKYGGKKMPEEECIVSGKQLEELEGIALRKIRDASLSKNFIKTPKLANILYRWRDWEGEKPVKEWVRDVIASDEGLVDFLAVFLSEGRSYGSGDRVARTHWRLDPKSIEPFVEDLSQVAERCRTLLESSSDWLTGRRRTAVETFVEWYEIRAAGKDPNSPLAWME